MMKMNKISSEVITVNRKRIPAFAGMTAKREELKSGAAHWNN